jgi:hypothetical protein
MATYSFSYNKEFSEAVASSTGTSNTDTKSRGVTLRQTVTPGFQYNGKFMSSTWVLVAALTTVNRLVGADFGLSDVHSLVRSGSRSLRKV